MKAILPPLSLQSWVRISFFNLLLVAALGVIMRYKIVFSLPIVNQKHLLNAHSNFAFTGWVGQALMTFIALYISENLPSFSLKKYNYLLFANLLAAYAMLVSFSVRGYGLTSTIFSTLSILVSYAFAIVVWRDLSRIPLKPITHNWIKAALVFSVLSSAGPFALAYMMATKSVHETGYLASFYYFLHFQYNGWFFFTCMGLIADKLTGPFISARVQRGTFAAFAFACIPAFFLSALWLPIPNWLYIIIVIAAFAQVIAWIIFVRHILLNQKQIFANTKPSLKYFFALSAAALSIKLLLQLGSTIPALSTWAFGFRPIIIGYLHLVFLGIFSIFILAYALYSKYIIDIKKVFIGAWIFIGGIILNEALLMTQGLGAVSYEAIPEANYFLLVATIIMFFGVLLLNVNQKKQLQ